MIGVFDDLAERRHPAGEHEHHAAQCIDLVTDLIIGKAGFQLGFKVFERQPGIGLPQPVVDRLDQRGFVFVMLVFDIADDFLDQILDGYQPIGAAIFIDDDRHMRLAGAHPRQQIDDAHRSGDIEHRAQQRFDREIGKTL